MRTFHARLILVLLVTVATVVANAVMVLSGSGSALYSPL